MRSWSVLGFPLLSILALLLALSVLGIAGCGKSDSRTNTANEKGRAAAPSATDLGSPSSTRAPATQRPGPIATAPAGPVSTQQDEAQSYRLKIPSIGVDAPISSVGLDPDGAIQAPNGPESVVWYDQSALPGWPGNSVLSGHLDWKTSTAVFWRLRELKPGDSIFVNTSNNARYRFTVEWTEVYAADKVPMTRVFADLQDPSLTIITCGGVFNSGSRDYSERLVVRAIGN